MTEDRAELIPYLCAKDAAAAMDFYKEAFGAKELFRLEGDDGNIGHATMEIMGERFYLSDEWPEGNVYSPQTLGGSPVALHLQVPDGDAVFDQAVGAAGLPRLGAGRQAPALELLELGAGRHLLGEQGGLDAVEQAFEPTHELGLGDAQFGLGGRIGIEGQRELGELLLELG